MSTANLTREQAAQRTATITVHDHEVVLDVRNSVEADQPMFPVTSTITFTSTVGQTWLDLRDGEVDEVLVNGEARPVDYDGARVQVDGLRAGATNTVVVRARARYSRSGQGLHRFVDPVDERTYLYTHFEPADARRVYPNFEQPDLKAVFHFRVLAPEGWVVRSNQPATSQAPAPDGGVRHEFAPTPRLSTYLTAVFAGDYHKVDGGSWVSPSGLEVPLGLFCRRSMADFLEADELLQVTRQGLNWYDANFGTPYPWGKYDQVFVPEYNLGAMENPGCVTFTEEYVYRSAATRAQRQGRANTVLHEMAHMWFGDLVTPAWWDDLWLKESFAEFMGAHVSVEATQYEQAWVAFAGHRKAWAYVQDQLPTTHPIVADITDLEAAAQNFDGITYAKGAAVLRQLVAHVGVEHFLAGARTYFAQHAFGSARLDDLLRALEDVSGRDLDQWSRAWLQTAGPDELVPEVVVTGDQVERLVVHQSSLDARTGEPVGRPHTLAVGLYRLDDHTLVREQLLPLELDGSASTEVPGAAGLPAPDLVLVNDTDLSYAKIGLDQRSLRTALNHLGGLADPLARALVWAALWNMTRDAKLSVLDYHSAVMTHGRFETDSATLTSLLANAWEALVHFVDDASRPAVREAHSRGLRAGLAAAEPGSDAQLVWARALARAAVDDRRLAEQVRGWYREAPAGLDFGSDLRWSVLRALEAQQLADPGALQAEQGRDPSAWGRTNALASETSRPSEQVKVDAWARVHDPRANSNDEVDALVLGLGVAGQGELLAHLQVGWFDTLEQTWRDHAQEIAQRLVRGLFPSTPGALDEADQWLSRHPDAPGALRRLVLEGRDQLRRSLAAQEFNRS